MTESLAKLAYRLDEAAHAIGTSQGKLRAAIKSGQISYVNHGTAAQPRYALTREQLGEYLATLTTEAK